VKGCYKLLNRNLNWNHAGIACRALHRDAHLVIINNDAEQKAIARMLENTPSQCTTIIDRESGFYEFKKKFKIHEFY